jgi:hypothetical protein
VLNFRFVPVAHQPMFSHAASIYWQVFPATPYRLQCPARTTGTPNPDTRTPRVARTSSRSRRRASAFHASSPPARPQVVLSNRANMQMRGEEKAAGPTTAPDQRHPKQP